MTTDEAIKWAGGTQSALAKRLDMTQPSISVWGEYPPPIRQLQIQRLSRGKLKAEESVLNPAAKPAQAA